MPCGQQNIVGLLLFGVDETGMVIEQQSIGTRPQTLEMCQLAQVFYRYKFSIFLFVFNSMIDL